MLLRLSPDERDLYYHLLEHLREAINERYEYHDIKKRLNIPDTVTNEMVLDLRNYFLDYIYPPAEKRVQLENAFSNLSNFISKPQKMWRLVGSMSAAIFKFGRHFPIALKAGFSSLKVFQDANNFEGTILKNAHSLKYQKPLTRKQFYHCITHSPRSLADNFITSVQSLLASFNNSILLAKTIDILNNVVLKMKQYPHIYPQSEIESIELGKEIIENGHRIFSHLHPQVKETVVNLVIKNEMWFLDSIYA